MNQSSQHYQFKSKNDLRSSWFTSQRVVEIFDKMNSPSENNIDIHVSILSYWSNIYIKKIKKIPKLKTVILTLNQQIAKIDLKIKFWMVKFRNMMFFWKPKTCKMGQLPIWYGSTRIYKIDHTFISAIIR